MPIGGIVSGIGSIASGFIANKGQREANKTNPKEHLKHSFTRPFIK